ncbi:DNA repair family protein-like protein [Delphinella strobiligena]|nr:DNA repair family protein-like protein [Delphinella strobiligena]
MAKRTIDSFFTPPQTKKLKVSTEDASHHPTYPFPVAQLPVHINEALGFAPATEGKVMNDQPDLDLVYFQPYLPKEIVKDLFNFLRAELFFYRVEYDIKRGPIETQIRTPRFTTVFGVDESSRFGQDGALLDSDTGKAIPKDRYKCQPRPLPTCLDALRKITEGSTGETYNFALVNYYASGDDSISYHSDDERFLGQKPAVASFSLGARRDFLMKHKPVPTSDKESSPEAKPLEFLLGNGDMILMRGQTQCSWLHSIPKRKGGESDRGRINITFRKAMVREGTHNYYRYNVGDGVVHKWDGLKGQMVPWSKLEK